MFFYYYPKDGECLSCFFKRMESKKIFDFERIGAERGDWDVFFIITKFIFFSSNREPTGLGGCTGHGPKAKLFC